MMYSVLLAAEGQMRGQGKEKKKVFHIRPITITVAVPVDLCSKFILETRQQEIR